MPDIEEIVEEYDRPIEIAEGVFWVGLYDLDQKLSCNPYLVVDGNEAVVIDAGNRPDFSTVMLKILQAQVSPEMIVRLIYDHYDPDLCGSIPHMEEIISSEDLAIITHHANRAFIKYYGATSPLVQLEDLHHKFTFGNGRTLRFIEIPYAHAEGSFVTFDEKTGTLFSGDLFGGYGTRGNLFVELCGDINKCDLPESCPQTGELCSVREILTLHRFLMTSGKALRYAIDAIRDLPIERIAPQHGSIINRKEDVAPIMDALYALEGVGIDKIVPGP